MVVNTEYKVACGNITSIYKTTVMLIYMIKKYFPLNGEKKGMLVNG